MMNAVSLGLISFAAMLAGSGAGQLLGRVLPRRHQDPETRASIILAMGLIITITSLTLGLLLYSTKTGFDTVESNLRTYVASIIVLDRSLRAYGEEADPAREALRHYTEAALHGTWPEEFGGARDEAPVESKALGQELFHLHDMIRHFSAGSASAAVLAAECRDDMNALVDRRYTLIQGVRQSIPPLLLGGVITWLAIIFVSLGLNAPRNPVVMITLGICALAAASCITLMDEMDGAFFGMIKVSSEPMREALASITD